MKVSMFSRIVIEDMKHFKIYKNIYMYLHDKLYLDDSVKDYLGKQIIWGNKLLR